MGNVVSEVHCCGALEVFYDEGVWKGGFGGCGCGWGIERIWRGKGDGFCFHEVGEFVDDGGELEVREVW